MPPYAPLMERFFKYVTPADGCWNWQGAVRLRDGYAALWDGSQSAPGYRISYEAFVGPIPEGLHIDHLCTNNACVRPDHLEPVTNRVNVLRGTGRTAQNARKTHCVHGHPFTPENTSLRRGERGCRTCAARRAKELNARRKKAQ